MAFHANIMASGSIFVVIKNFPWFWSNFPPSKQLFTRLAMHSSKWWWWHWYKKWLKITAPKKSFSLEKKKVGGSPQGAFLTVFEVLLAFLHTSGSGQWKASSVGIFRSFASPQLIFHVARKRGRRKVPSVNSAKQSCSEKCTIFRDEGLLCLPSPLNFPWLWEIQAAKSKFEP